MAKAPLSQTVFLTEDGTSLASAAVDIPPTDVAPTPAFTAAPSIVGTPRVGQPLSALTYIDGTVSNGSVIGRTYLLGGAPKPISYVLQDADVGAALVYRNTATGGVVMASSAAVTVQAAEVTPVPGELPALTTSAPLRRGTQSAIDLLGLPAGATISGTYPGMTRTGTQLIGTPTARSALVSYTTSEGATRDTLLFAPKGGARRMLVGMGIEGLARYAPNYEWLDYMKVGEWDTPPATVDENGMPLTLNPGPYGGFVASFLTTIDSGVTMPIKYRLLTDGDIDFEVVAFRNSDAPENYSFSATPTKEGDDHVFTFTGGGIPDVNFYVIFRRVGDTKPTYCNLVRDDEVARFRAGFTFKKSFVDEIGKFAWLRGMNWHGGNFADAPSRKINRLTYADGGGVPAEVLAKVATEAKMPIWINVHHKISLADFLAIYVPIADALIAAGCDVYFEVSNEVWNGHFPQNAYSAQAARDTGYTGQHAATWWVGHMSAAMAKATRGKGYKWLIGVQSVNQPFLSDILDLGIASIDGSLPTDFYGWHCSWYSGGILSQNYDLAPGMGEKMDGWVVAENNDAAYDNLLNFMDPRQGYRTNSTEDNQVRYAEAKAIALRRSLKLFGYEGQIDLNSIPNSRNPTAYDPFFFKMVAHPIARHAAVQMMETCEDNGFFGVTWFDWGSLPANSYFGRYGMKAAKQALISAFEWQAALPVGGGGSTPAPGGRFWRLRVYGISQDYKPLEITGRPMASGVRALKDGVALSLAGVQISGDDNGNPNESGANLIDADPATVWVGDVNKTNVRLFDFGEGKVVAPDAWEIRDRADNTGASPGDYDWSCSTDGINWTVGFRTVKFGTINTPGNAYYQPQNYYGDYGSTHVSVAPITYA